MDRNISPPALVREVDHEVVCRAIAARKRGNDGYWEEADCYADLAARGWTQRKIADAVKISQAQVSRLIACSKLTPRVDFSEAYRSVNEHVDSLGINPTTSRDIPPTTSPASSNGKQALPPRNGTPFVFRERCEGGDEEAEEKPDDVDAHGRKKAKPAPRKPQAPRDAIKDKVGNVVPDRCRDAFADPSLTEMIEELETIASMYSVDPWTKKAGKLTDHYGFILIDKFAGHSLESLHEIQLAIESLKAGVPFAVCPKCNGEEKESKCRGCRGYGHVPEHRYQELSQ